MDGSPIQRLEPAISLRRSVEESLSAAIVSGEFEPGSIITVPTLAERFGVSATPVREAMLDLAKRGFVTPVRNKGYRVTEVSEQNLVDLMQVRRWLEAPAMKVLAETFPAVTIEPYRQLADTTLDAARKNDFREYLAADSAFHLALLELVGNPLLVQIVGDLRRQTRMVGLVSLKDSPELEQSTLEHHTLLDYLAEGRGDDACQLMHKHIGHVSGLWAGNQELGEDEDSEAAPRPVLQ